MQYSRPQQESLLGQRITKKTHNHSNDDCKVCRRLTASVLHTLTAKDTQASSMHGPQKTVSARLVRRSISAKTHEMPLRSYEAGLVDQAPRYLVELGLKMKLYKPQF